MNYRNRIGSVFGACAQQSVFILLFVVVFAIRVSAKINYSKENQNQFIQPIQLSFNDLVDGIFLIPFSNLSASPAEKRWLNGGRGTK